MERTRRLLLGGDIWTEHGFVRGSLLLEGAVVEAIIPAGDPLPDDAVVVDVAGAAVLPGFVDAHAHPLIGGTEFSGAPVREARSVAEALRIVADHAAAHPGLPWVLGEGFDLSIDPRGSYSAADLDRVVPDRPVALRSSDIHTMWANTAALRAAGITAETPDPEDGIIERDADGAPTGTLREWGAFMPLYRAIPRRTSGEIAEALRRGLDALSAEGVTTVQDAWVELDDLDGYLEAARGGLPVRLNLAFRAEPGRWRDQIAQFHAARERVADLGIPEFTARTVKFFADGIIEGGTAHVAEPYHGTGCCGVPAWRPEELAEAARACDAAGFQLHIHAIGDAGLACAVDAIEGAAAANGPRDRRPVIAHAQLVRPRDLRRLVDADVTVAIQPYWAKLDGVVRHLTNGRLHGDRAERQYPFETMRLAGVRLASSSDFPITTPSPLQALGVATSRDEHGDLGRSWLPAERLAFADALRAATAGAAYTQYAEGRLGVIAPGAAADLTIVHGLSRDPSPAELLAARVEAVWRDGEPAEPSALARAQAR
ncbi:amidohydrolase family protein [Leucobacter allii]|uniref:amidohydrolase n=1 Tax=Leucobacter allii TaxID=2932247 RepID=UPI001FD265AE|nr:amidohydrolase [Leucobacter allii]UOR01296.1 amidohydrolase family protein [Leucobacter allii]